MSSTPDPNPDGEAESNGDRPPENMPVVEVRISNDRSLATLVIPEDFDPFQMEVAIIVRCARERGVILADDVMAQLEEIAQSFRDRPRPIEKVVARATPPVDGEDGRLEWQEGFNPEEHAQPVMPDDEDGRVDFYNQVSYVGVEVGDHIATILPPTEGEEGRDVTGASIPSKPGKPVDVKTDPSLVVADDGRVLAQTAGVLEFSNRTLSIARLMEVAESVDFSTGNINFDGSVHVREGVRDRFVVKTTENLAVDGLVEAATIITGKDFHCRRGVAAKDRGQILVGGDAHVGYLNNVRGRIRGSLFVRRELMDCELIVGKNLVSSQGAIIGGRVIVTGEVQIGSLGSGGGAATMIVLGEVPLLAAQIHRLDTMIRECRSELERMREACETSGSAGDVRLPTALQAKASRLLHRIAACTRKREELLEEVPAKRTLSLQVSKVIRAKVHLRVADREFLFEEDMRGPLRVEWDGRRQIVCRRGDGQAGPIFDFAREVNIAA